MGPIDLKEKEEKIRKSADDVWKDFKAFAFQGNVIDLAVGVVIGGAFNNIVQSLTHDVVLPLFGKLLGNVDFSGLYINLSGKYYPNLNAAVAANAPVIKYGSFITNIIDFLIIALSLFIFLKIVLRKKYHKDEEKK